MPGAAAVGGIVGIGGAAFIGAAIPPCAGFHAMFLLNDEYCAAQTSYRRPQVAAYRRARAELLSLSSAQSGP